MGKFWIIDGSDGSSAITIHDRDNLIITKYRYNNYIERIFSIIIVIIMAGEESYLVHYKFIERMLTGLLDSQLCIEKIYEEITRKQINGQLGQIIWIREIGKFLMPQYR